MQVEYGAGAHASDLLRRQEAALKAFLRQGVASLNDDLSMQLVALWWEEEVLWILYRCWQYPDRTLGVYIRLPSVPEDIAIQFYILREPGSEGWYDNERGVWWQSKEERPETWPAHVVAALEETKGISELTPHVLWLTSTENWEL